MEITHIEPVGELGSYALHDMRGDRVARFDPGALYRRCNALTIGPVSLPAVLLVELDLASISTALGVRVAGILGFDLFAQTVIRLRHCRPRIGARCRQEGVHVACVRPLGLGRGKNRATWSDGDPRKALAIVFRLVFLDT